MKYNILPYSFNQAKKIGVKIIPSDNPKYKIDVFTDEGEYITSIGARGYKDFPTYMQEKGHEYANKRRELYHKRHNKENIEGTRGWFSLHILW
jgi:hypothetical protein